MAINMFGRMLREHSRAQAVKGLGALATAGEPPFQRFVEDAALAFDAPLAMLSLIYNDKMWFKATYGLATESMPRGLGFCTHALDQPDVLEVCDPQSDPRFRDLPSVVADPLIRYYIGAPLRLSDGVDVGALCVVDTHAREPVSADQRAYLLGLARQASMALETRDGSLAEFAR